MSITLIAAVAANGVIGIGNALPWRLPAEMAYFTRQTTGKTVLMGRKTFESLKRPLKDRKNVILSRTMETAPEGCELVRSVEDAVRRYGAEELMVIGGSELYAQTLGVADRLLLTEIGRSYEGDSRFPEFDKNDWVLVSRMPGVQDEKNDVPYDFCVYERRRQ
ncbi:dihydrofolate reductase [Cohnella xylanilytica]|uniref:dihydrofolate reductase n=1 Tax=Cohnella xylanilytica TaxID=557555 RepID=UPI001AFEBD4F|nr:dihydrofolate reductase [Cohnella xylanilytica]GIO11477.1 dihydrofolate reductase [Cohnella xylanilytica]